MEGLVECGLSSIFLAIGKSEHCGILFSLLMKQTGSRQDHQVAADETLLQWHQPRDWSRKGQYPSLCSTERSVTCRGSEQYIHEARHGTLGERTDQLHVTVRTSYTSWCLAIYGQLINSQWPSSILLIFHVYNHSSARCISMGLNRWSMHFISWQSIRYPPGNNQYESSGGAFHIPPFNWEDGGTDEDADGIEWEDVTKAVDIDRSLWSSTSSICGRDGGLWECSFWRSQGTS